MDVNYFSYRPLKDTKLSKPKPWAKYSCQFRGCPVTNNDKVSMHCFPKSEERCKQWIEACGKDSLKNVTLSRQWYNAKLCGNHFEDWCFLNWTKKRLTRNAIPCTAERPILEPVHSPSIQELVKLPILPKIKEVKEKASEYAGTIKFGHETNGSVYNAIPRTKKTNLHPVRSTSIQESARSVTPLDIREEAEEEENELNNAVIIKLRGERLACENLEDEKYREQIWTSIKSRELKENLINDGISEELVDFILCRIKLRKTEPQRKMYKIEGRQCLYTICKDKDTYILPD